MNEELLQILACPACRGELAPLGQPGEPGGLEGLACPACALVYPLIGPVNGAENGQIPVLLKEEAVRRLEWDAGKRRARPARNAVAGPDI